MREAVIVASSRTPLAKSHRGSFNITRPDDLAAHCIAHVLAQGAAARSRGDRGSRSSAAASRTAPQGHNIARVAALRAGLPVTTPGVTVNRFCNSGLQAIVQAAHMVTAGRRRGGDRRRRRVDHDDAARQLAESVGEGAASRASTWRWATPRRSSPSATTSRREAQDEYSLVSQQRTARAQQDGFFKGEIAPMQVTRAVLDKKTGEKVGEEDVLVERDECNRADTTLEGLREAAAGLRHDERQGQRHRRQLVAALRRRVGHAGDVGAIARRRSASAAARLPRLCGRRLRAGRDGHRPGVRGAEAARRSTA